MIRRPLVALLTTCALLAQSWAIAGMGPMLGSNAPQEQAAAADEAMPCHGAAEQQQAPTADCCADERSCAQVCAGATGMIASLAAPTAPSTTDDVEAEPATTVFAAHTLTPLRPPITSLS